MVIVAHHTQRIGAIPEVGEEAIKLGLHSALDAGQEKSEDCGKAEPTPGA